MAAYVQDLGDACLGVWEADNKNVRLYREARVKPFYGFEVPQWLPDSSGIVTKLAPSGPHLTESAVGVKECEQQKGLTVFTSDPAVAEEPHQSHRWMDRSRADLGRVDLATGQVARLAEDLYFTGWRVDPTGQRVALLQLADYDEGEWLPYYDLIVISLNGGPQRTLVSRIQQEYGISFNWSPSGRSIAYTTQRIYIVSGDGTSGPLDLTDLSRCRDAHLYHKYEPPRWSEDENFLYCLDQRGSIWEFESNGAGYREIRPGLPMDVRFWIQSPLSPLLKTNGEALWVAMGDACTKDEGIAVIDLKSGTGKIVSVFNKSSKGGHLQGFFGMEMAADGSALLLLESAQHPPELWKIDARYHLRRLYTPNPDLDRVSLGTARLLQYRTLEGVIRQGALLLPPDADMSRPLPLIVRVYPWEVAGSAMLHRFGFGDVFIENAQVLASRGTAVFVPDIPLRYDHRLRIFEDAVLSGVNHLINSGLADPDRLGLIGHSAGGYCVLGLLTRTTRFRAAVCSTGCVNLTSATLTLEGGNEWLGWSGTFMNPRPDTPWDNRSGYVEDSPFFFLDSVRTPLLLACGTRDKPATAQAGVTFSALRRLNQRVELRLYHDEGHSPSTWSSENLIDLSNRILDWFDMWLKVPPAEKKSI
ncbi:MAG: prolyl oligopeptidase family serine peptidase [Armatimonadetes bacterium]|nr:prolyl oligopeptidase family serine peptidase [Armatimonadota bacterium]